MKIGIILALLMPLLLSAVCVAAQEGVDRSPVATLELERYMGTWYEIARCDHRSERGLRAVRMHCRQLPDGGIRVVAEGVKYRTGNRRSVRGRVRVAAPGVLRVSFFWFFYSDYRVLELDGECRWALVGGRSADRLWILSRTPSLPGRTLNRILRLAQRRGYSTAKLLYVAQE